MKAVAVAIAGLDQAWFAQRYATLEETDHDGPIGAGDRDDTWESFTAARELFDRASRGGRAMIFTVDQ